MAKKERTIQAKKESEAMDFDAPEDFTSLVEYDPINEGDLFFSPLSLKTTNP